MAAAPKLLAKLHKIMESVNYIQKDKTNSHQNYKYASEKAIKEALHAAFVANKVLMQVSTKNPQIVGSSFCIEVVYTFIDVESEEELSGTFVGTGQTRDEKGNYSAVTGAIKYILTSTFLIPTGDDPERDETPKAKKPAVPASAPATKDLLDEIAKLCQETDTDPLKLYALYHVVNPTAATAPAMIESLKKKLAKMLDEVAKLNS
jgi:hypothetical protein